MLREEDALVEDALVHRGCPWVIGTPARWSLAAPGSLVLGCSGLWLPLARLSAAFAALSVGLSVGPVSSDTMFASTSATVSAKVSTCVSVVVIGAADAAWYPRGDVAFPAAHAAARIAAARIASMGAPSALRRPRASRAIRNIRP